MAETSETSPPPIKRAAVTYGRRKISEVDHDPDSSMTLGGQSPYSREEAMDLVQQGSNGGSFLPKDVLSASQSSITTCAADDEGEADEPFEFEWKRRFKKIDDEDDDEHSPQKIQNTDDILHLEEQREKDTTGLFVDRVDTAPPSPRGADSTSNSLLGGSLPTLTDSSLPNSSFIESFDDYPVPPPRHSGKSRRILNSDCEQDEVGASSNASPAKFPIDTPQRDPSSSPPTSEADMPPRAVKKSGKGKGKAPVRNITPIPFDDQLLSGAPSGKDKRKRKEKQTRSRIKPPTMKELRETALENIRLQSHRTVEIQRTEDSARYSLTNLFTRVKNDAFSTIPKNSLPSSDPIVPFSSSPRRQSADDGTAHAAHFGPATGLLEPSPEITTSRKVRDHVKQGVDDGTANAVHFGPATALLESSPELTTSSKKGHPYVQQSTSKRPAVPMLDSDDEDFPTLAEMLAPPRNNPDRNQKLREAKAKLVEEQSQRAMSREDSDDDLEVVPSDTMHVIADKEAAKRKSEKIQGGSSSKGKARQSLLGKPAPLSPLVKKSKPTVPSGDLMGYLRESARTSFQTDGKARKVQSHADLNRFILQEAEAAKLRIVESKEQEWKKLGGTTLADHDGAEENSLGKSVSRYANHALEVGNSLEQSNPNEQDDDSEGTDEEYRPDLRGSASPEPMEHSDEENENVVPDIEETNHETTDTEDEIEKQHPRVHRKSTRVQRVIDSDDEAMGNKLQPRRQQTLGRVLVPDSSLMDIQQSPSHARGHRSSISSLDEPTEDNDKENDTRLMYDKSDDKENKAVVRHSPLGARHALGSRPGTLFGLEEGGTRGLTVSSFADPTESPGVRTPLKELSREDEDPFLSPSTSRPSFTARLEAAASRANTPPLPLTLLPALRSPATLQGTRKIQSDSSEFFGAKSDDDFKPQALQFSQSQGLLPSPSLAPLNPPPGNGFSQFFSDTKGDGTAVFKKPQASRDPNELSLTLDVGLQPVLEVSGTLRRKAEAIFEKEQDFVVETANQKPEKKDVLYVNDHGFLTQTRPDASPEIYRLATPSQIARLRSPDTGVKSSRQPLRTISFMKIENESAPEPLRRLRRRSTSPSENRDHLLANPLQKNAFDVLGKQPRRDENRKKLAKSAFVEAEAEESDDDEFGFGPKRGDCEEEEDGEDQDEDLKGLVNDAEIEVQENLVMEKVREHMEEDDREVEKIHRDAIEGRFRTKRRNREFGLNDDSDEEDDERARRIRKSMYKKRKIEGDHLEALGQRDETRAFYDAYQKDLVDDEDLEFKHLQQQDTEMADVVEQGVEEETQEVVSYDEIREQVRKVAQDEKSAFTLDPQDDSWLDDDVDEEDNCKVRVVQSRSNKAPRRNHVDIADFETERPSRKAESEQHNAKMISWARSQNGRNQGTGRSAGGAAVTGHSKAKLKAGGGSLRSGQSSASSSSNVGGKGNTRKLERHKNPSILASVSDRSGRFA